MTLNGSASASGGAGAASRHQEDYYAREVKELLEWCERFNKGSLDNFE